MAANPMVYKWLSALMCYPEQELLDALPEFQTALDQWPELAPKRQELQTLLDHLGSQSLRQLQEDYVLVFDRTRQHALYIFEHVYGEDRDRGSAMVDLLEEYRRHGFELGDEELPDYLPALLEFFAHIPAQEAEKLLGDAVHVIHHIGKNLAAYGSPYAALLQAAVSLSPVEPQPLLEPHVRDLDEAMETLGPDPLGIEPLLIPIMQTVQFYHGGRH